ncbi:hypothetical protein J8F10_21435 [Gemmata sp. G18]|uniref:Uncharacterized protein n=1 Tax=Gemmata palustris TaxID=2822762 RepID=A0ABS5BVU3_9BACT|nr:hypothetical protein [Gemmata palustris]MBP3957824.1 hypothetical protein [Gemmata palustris]
MPNAHAIHSSTLRGNLVGARNRTHSPPQNGTRLLVFQLLIRSNQTMNTLLACALFGAKPVQPPNLKFDTLTLAHAKRFVGDNVTITFTTGRPSYTWGVNGQLRTICGPVMRDGDDQERTVSLIGDRTKRAREGKTLTVRGTLRVVHHDAVTINGIRVEAWADIRFEERERIALAPGLYFPRLPQHIDESECASTVTVSPPAEESRPRLSRSNASRARAG